MNRVDKVLGKYFLFSLPLLGVLIVLGLTDDPDNLSRSEGLIRYVWDFLGWVLMIWILVSFYLSIKMIFSRPFRDQTLKKFLRVKDRDERESMISGEAAKLSMISTSAIVLLMLFLSIMTVSVGKEPGAKMFTENKNHFISIGFSPLNGNISQKDSAKEGTVDIFTYSGLPLPTSIILVLILAWQLITFHWIVRRSEKP